MDRCHFSTDSAHCACVQSTADYLMIFETHSMRSYYVNLMTNYYSIWLVHTHLSLDIGYLYNHYAMEVMARINSNDHTISMRDIHSFAAVNSF